MAPLAQDRILYTFNDVDRLAMVSRGTARRWLLGYSYVRHGTRFTAAPITAASSGAGATFLGLTSSGATS